MQIMSNRLITTIKNVSVITINKKPSHLVFFDDLNLQPKQSYETLARFRSHLHNNTICKNPPITPERSVPASRSTGAE